MHNQEIDLGGWKIKWNQSWRNKYTSSTAASSAAAASPTAVRCGCAKTSSARWGSNKIARFRLGPRDQRNDDDFYEFIGEDNGVFGCRSLLVCHDVCPQNLPLSTQIAFFRRKMAAVGWKLMCGLFSLLPLS